MKNILSQLNSVIAELENKGNVKQAESLEKIFIKIASNDILFDPRQKGSDLDDMLAKNPHVEPMKYHKKKVRVKVKRVK